MKLEKNEHNLHEITKLIEYAFNKKPGIATDPVFLARYNNATCYGNLTGTKLTSLVMVNHFQGQLYEQTLPVAGIGYVASYPEVRGDGGVTKIMNELLTDLGNDKVSFSLLAPFSEGFYQRFGYENILQQKHYHFTKSAFNYFASEKLGQVQRGRWSDESLQELIISLYQKKLAEGQQGVSLARDKWWWDRQDEYYGKRWYAVCFDENDNPCGYLIYRMNGDTFIIDELCYFNAFGVRKLLTFVKAHVSSFENFVYAAPVDELIEFFFTEQAEIEITLQPYMMGRIIDFKRIMEKLAFTKPGTFYFEVTADRQCPANQGIWEVKVETTVTCTKVKAGPVDLAGEIGAWTRLIFGDEQLADLVFLNLLGVKQQRNELETIFPQGKHTFYDYF